MGNIEPTELKIMLTSIAGAIISPVDMIIKFVIPIASGIAWVFLKPYVLKLKNYLYKKYHETK